MEIGSRLTLGPGDDRPREGKSRESVSQVKSEQLLTCGVAEIKYINPRFPSKAKAPPLTALSTGLAPHPHSK